MKLPALILFVLILLAPFVTAQAAPELPDVPDTAYLFSYFVDNGQEGLRLAWSRDGIKWEALNNGLPLLTPPIGKARVMRDPCVAQGPDGRFHMVWTDSRAGRTIGYASTRDFISWSRQRELSVMQDEPTAKNCWAPEIVYDPGEDHFILLWASTIPGRFPRTEYAGENDNNHRIYSTTTRDFETFTPTKLFFDPGFNVIDSTLLTLGSRTYMFFKDETKFPAPKKNLRLAVADSLAGPYAVFTEAINPPGAWVEGPTTLQIGDTTYVYFDAYTQHHYAALRSKDLKTWEDITPQLSMPVGIRHGTAFTVSGDLIKRLLSPVKPGPLVWNNPLISQRADPHVTLHTDGNYYLTCTVPEYDRIELRRAPTLGELASSETKVIWRKHGSGPMGAHIWGAELHFIDGKWYIYFAAGEAKAIWNIRLYVLKNDSPDPFTGEWIEKGRLKTQWDTFTLSPTTFVHRDERYLAWTQAPPGQRGTDIYLARMDTPLSISGEPVRLTTPEFPWELIGHRVNEAPAVLQRNGRVFLTYSASATDANYCMGLLTASEDADLLNPASWHKSSEPILKSSPVTNQFGPGHNCFTTTPDGQTDIILYHARNYEKIRGDTHRNPDRAIRVQIIEWHPDGTPDFRIPAPDGPPR